MVIVDVQHCDTVITRSYTGEKSVDSVQAREESIVIKSNDSSEQHVKFDRIPAQVRYSRLFNKVWSVTLNLSSNRS